MLAEQLGDGFKWASGEVRGVEVSHYIDNRAQVWLLGEARLHKDFKDRVSLSRDLSEVVNADSLIL